MAQGPREVRPYIRPPNFATTFLRSQWAATDAPTRPHAPVRAALAALFDGPPDVSLWRTCRAQFGLIRPPNFATTFLRSQWAATDAPTRPHAPVRAALAALFDG